MLSGHFSAPSMETPPRTWRRLEALLLGTKRSRNTSTDVEKTKTPDRARLSLQKHLHGRGEDCCRLFSDADRQGNTSTDVEKTSSRPEVRMPTWKHLHGCGEDSVRAYIVMTAGETPPRTWRRLARFLHTVTARRNTSTDVEKTSAGDTGLWHFEKHLHGRGEDPVVAPTSKLPRETPPRTWRRHTKDRAHNVAKRKHLHGRGEDKKWKKKSRLWMETPPRTWRRLNRHLPEYRIDGNTSTDVEKTFTTGFKPMRLRKHLHGRGEDF